MWHCCVYTYTILLRAALCVTFMIFNIARIPHLGVFCVRRTNTRTRTACAKAQLLSEYLNLRVVMWLLLKLHNALPLHSKR